MDKLTPRTPDPEPLPKCLTALPSSLLALGQALETDSAAHGEKAAAVCRPRAYFQSAYGLGKAWLNALPLQPVSCCYTDPQS